ncbi:MAG: glycosyltransferase family 2 protein [Anaerolineaceae bacterium]|nr:glycosyltransferase family 2 protein [Anaerolineaceae bacterium]
MRELLILIPAHNEEQSITAVVKSARKYMPVLVIDDGSNDDTARLAERAGAEVIRQMPNQGKGTALMTGFKQALGLNYRAVITLDGDGQHEPAEIPLFISAWHDRPVSLIIGQRDFSQMPFIRRLANSLGRVVFSLFVGQYIADNQSGYRLIDHRLMALMLENEERGFEFEVEMVALALKHNLGISWVPIQTIYTSGSSHIKPLHHLLHFFRICRKSRQIIRGA